MPLGTEFFWEVVVMVGRLMQCHSCHEGLRVVWEVKN